MSAGIHWMPFLLACVAIMVIPGPNVALMGSHTLTGGRRAGFAILAGIMGGQALQVLLVLCGLGALLQAWGLLWQVMKLAGLIYLFVLGIKAFVDHPAATLHGDEPVPGARDQHFSLLVRRGFLVALSNPKTMVFLAAFLPQFVRHDASSLSQLPILGLAYLLVGFSVDGTWVLVFARARALFLPALSKSVLKWVQSGVYFLLCAWLAVQQRSA